MSSENDSDKEKANAEIAGDDGSAEKRSQSQAGTLVELADQSGLDTLFHTPDGDCYAILTRAGHQEVWPIKSTGFRGWLSQIFYKKLDRVPNSQALQDAIGNLSGRALFDGEAVDVHVRIAGHGGKVYFDLCNESWQSVELSRNGWKVIDQPPVMFRRTKGMLPLPLPAKGGSIDDLRPFVNVISDEWLLLVGWLVGCFNPSDEFAILALTGEQDSAKTTVGMVCRQLIDPNRANLRAAPREQRDLSIAANNSRIVAFDNISSVQAWISDALCRVATGGGFAVRKNYTDDEEQIFEGARPVILTGIGNYADKSDLIDRCVFLHLSSIGDDNRIERMQFWNLFEEARPLILGALLDGAVSALRGADEMRKRFKSIPRMSSFAVWAAAAMEQFGHNPEDFMSAYQRNRAGINETVIEDSRVAQGVIGLMDENSGHWEGTHSDILVSLWPDQDGASRKRQGLPPSTRAMAQRLMEVVPNLRKVGISVVLSETKTRRGRLIRITRDSTDTTDTTDISSTEHGDGPSVGSAGRITDSEQPSPHIPVQSDGRDGGGRPAPASSARNGNHSITDEVSLPSADWGVL